MIPPTSPTCCLYFGCLNRHGHYVHFPENHRSINDVSKLLSTKDWIESMDGCLHDEQSDQWLIHCFQAADKTQMTFIAKRDRSVDTRPGSWAGFLMPGVLQLATALQVARKAFPNLKVWSEAMTPAQELNDRYTADGVNRIAELVLQYTDSVHGGDSIVGDRQTFRDKYGAEIQNRFGTQAKEYFFARLADVDSWT